MRTERFRLGGLRRRAGRVRDQARRAWSTAQEQVDQWQRERAFEKLRAQVRDVRRVNVGCGPHNLMPGWCNVDIRPFAGIDVALDVTRAWPFDGLDYVYSEHFLEHLDLLDGVRFLHNSAVSLRPGGKTRISTPNLSWVMRTHYAMDPDTPQARIHDTFRTNRAFHGWGHRFLYSLDFLREVLTHVGFEAVQTFGYGESNDPALRGVERHGGFGIHHGEPSVVIVEATRGPSVPQWPEAFETELRDNFVRYVQAGH